MLIAPKSPDEPERIQALHQMNILDTPINPIFERITRITKNMFGVPIVAISIIDSERQWFKSTQGLNVCENDLQTSFCSHAILQDDIFLVTDAHKDARFSDNPCVTGNPHVRFYAGCPVQSEDGHKIGTLCIIDSKPREISQDMLATLKDMASLVQDELQKYKQHYTQSQIIQELDRAKRAKLIDGLTGVWNREGTEINLQEQMTSAKTDNNRLVVAIFDIDDFKKVNDTFGHNYGDEVIREVCKRVVIACADDDIIGRWGGEEFIIIAKCKDNHQDIMHRIDQARIKVCADPVIYEQSKISPSITVGITIYDPKLNLSAQQIVEKADAALYEGKRSGKNRCVLYSAELPI